MSGSSGEKGIITKKAKNIYILYITCIYGKCNLRKILLISQTKGEVPSSRERKLLGQDPLLLEVRDRSSAEGRARIPNI